MKMLIDSKSQDIENFLMISTLIKKQYHSMIYSMKRQYKQLRKQLGKCIFKLQKVCMRHLEDKYEIEDTITVQMMQ